MLAEPPSSEPHLPPARGSRHPKARRPRLAPGSRRRSSPDSLGELRPLYVAATEPGEVVVPTMHFLMLDGHGDPMSGGEFRAAVEALYPVAWALKSAQKQHGLAYRLLPLEALWWTEPNGRFDPTRSRETWCWTAMLAVPRAVSWDDVGAAREAVERRRSVPGVDRIHLGSISEGAAAQVLHHGPYATEGPAVAWLNRYVARKGWHPVGKHHELYLSDARRTAPDEIRTVLRQPMRPA